MIMKLSYFWPPNDIMTAIIFVTLALAIAAACLLFSLWIS